MDKIEERLQDVVKIKELCTGMETKFENFQKEINQIREANIKNEQDIDILHKENVELRAKIREMDQYSRNANLVIRGSLEENKEITKEPN